jgi:ribosomal protein S8
MGLRTAGSAAATGGMGPLVGTGLNIVGGLVTAGMSEGAGDELRGAIEGQEIVSLEDRIAQYQQYKQQGLLTPEMEAEILAKDSQLAQVVADPQYKQAQIEALTRMSRIGREGMLLSDQTELAKQREETGAQLRGAQQAVMQNRAARGLAGGGDELAMQMANAQAAATQQAQADRDIAAQSQARRLEAISRTGNMAGEMSNQEYGRAANVAKARDAIEAFNVQNRTGTQQRNIGSRNVAQQANLSEKQRIADQNTGLQHKQEEQKIAARQAIAAQKNLRAQQLGQMTKEQQLGEAEAVGGAISSTGKMIGGF